MQKIVLAALVALGLAGCAGAAPTDPQLQKLTGEIHIKGNEPFPMVVLETASHETWELVGMPLSEARSRANEKTTVEGTVIRAPGPGVWLPSLRMRGSAQPSER